MEPKKAPKLKKKKENHLSPTSMTLGIPADKNSKPHLSVAWWLTTDPFRGADSRNTVVILSGRNWEMMEDDRDLEKEKPVAESFFFFKYTPVENERNASSLKRGTC